MASGGVPLVVFRPLHLLPLVLACTLLGCIPVNKSSLRERTIKQCAQFECTFHNNRMGLIQGKGKWSDLPGSVYADFVVYPDREGGGARLPKQVSYILGGEENWYTSCFACAEGLDRWATRRKFDAAWEVWKNEICPLHGHRLVPAVRRPKQPKDPIPRARAAQDFPHASSLGFSRIEMTIEGAESRWMLGCFECEEALDQFYFDAFNCPG